MLTQRLAGLLVTLGYVLGVMWVCPTAQPLANGRSHMAHTGTHAVPNAEIPQTGMDHGHADHQAHAASPTPDDLMWRKVCSCGCSRQGAPGSPGVSVAKTGMAGSVEPIAPDQGLSQPIASVAHVLVASPTRGIDHVPILAS